jgi:regulator of protease activity HflC (stomatin/prohibitin superfamily)
MPLSGASGSVPSALAAVAALRGTAQVAVITRFGKFRRVAEPGLNWKWPFIDGA